MIGAGLRKLWRYAYMRLTMRAFEEGMRMGRLLAAIPAEESALWALDNTTKWES